MVGTRLGRIGHLPPGYPIACNSTKEGDSGLLRAVCVHGKYREKLLGMTIQPGEGVSGLVAAGGPPCGPA